MHSHRQSGFTLIELMIVVVIAAIIAAIAIPSYTSYIRKGRRSDAQSGLLQAQACYERCFTRTNTYVSCDTNCGVPGLTPQSYYNLTESVTATNTSYTLTATPIGPQALDAQCTTLTINQQAVKGQTGSATAGTCWAS
jgi:type IV pilus assembly protein PilE